MEDVTLLDFLQKKDRQFPTKMCTPVRAASLQIEVLWPVLLRDVYVG